MARILRRTLIIAAAAALAAPLASVPEPTPAEAAATLRAAEDLGRGVVAVRSSSTQVLVTWRLLGLDPASIAFDVYRSTDGGTPTKLNSAPVSGGTNFLDETADLTKDNAYAVVPIVDGVEQERSEAFTLTADHAVEPAVRIPLREGDAIKYAWVGDLDGDGEYDYVVDRHGEQQQSIEAYLSDGTFLWEIDLGPNSANRNNIEPGSSTIDVGHWDGVTVSDLDSDGTAEVAIRVADGVAFGDGEVFELEDDLHQSIAVVDGLTGALEASAPLPDDYIADGPLAARLGVGYLDGEHPSLVGYLKNRIGSGDFNLVYVAWSFDGDALTQEWEWHRGGAIAPDGHNTRILDVDGDGDDEIAEIGFVLDGDGTLRYSLGDSGIAHGDRFHITDIDPSRPGLEGYGVQQDNPSGLREYVYDAADGTILWSYSGEDVVDVGRGMAADIDPSSPGMEVWSFSGVKAGSDGNLLVEDTSLAPWPDMGIQWDGDLATELLNNRRVEQWDPDDPADSGSLPRLLATWDYGAVGASGTERNPLFYGDILGDWREEIVMTSGTFDELIVFTTDQPTSTRLYTLAHNPQYRNEMTVKGYLQSHHVDYYLGTGMTAPAAPDIRYVEAD